MKNIHMQYINNHHFSGKWITSEEFVSLEKINVFYRYLDGVKLQKSAYQNKHILFRKRFSIDGFKTAEIFICADDLYKLFINGVFVGSGSERINCYDITSYLKKGENLIAVHTYYQGLINRVFESGNNLHGLICDIVADGKTVLSSDESFLYAYHDGFSSNGITGYDTQFLERYDTSANQVGFEMPDFDDNEWKSSVVFDNSKDYSPSASLEFETIKPGLTKTDYGYFADYGKNYVGWLNLRVKGKKGKKTTLRYGQETENGRVRYKMRANCKYEDEIILSGNEDKFSSFDYKAFRYAEIILPNGATIDESSVSLTTRHYPLSIPERHFENEDLQSIWDLCAHTLKNGIQESVIDCPDREKGCYLGDGCYIALTVGKLTGNWVLFKQLIRDALKTKAVSPTLLTCLNCSLIQEIAEFPLIMIICTGIYYSITNDSDFVAEILDDFKKLLDCYKSAYTNKEGLICKTDKWCVAEWPENFRDGYDVNLSQNTEINSTHCVINAYYYAAMCAYNSLAGRAVFDSEAFRKAYLYTFYDGERKCFKDSVTSNHSSLISNSFSYAFGLCPDNETKESIILEIEKRGINSLNIFGVFPLLFRLQSDNKDISKHILNPNAWLNMINEGASTTFETWGKEQKWNTSLFHITLSYIAFFM